MIITIDLETCKIIVFVEKHRPFAVFISKLTGETMTMPLPVLIEKLEQVAKALGQVREGHGGTN